MKATAARREAPPEALAAPHQYAANAFRFCSNTALLVFDIDRLPHGVQAVLPYPRATAFRSNRMTKISQRGVDERRPAMNARLLKQPVTAFQHYRIIGVTKVEAAATVRSKIAVGSFNCMLDSRQRGIAAMRGTFMPSIFTVANPKGGSGKTTVAIILAGEFSKHGYSVAIVDADPQGSSYQWHASSVGRGLSPQGIDLVRAPDDKTLAQAVDRLEGHDVVIIDTPGYYGSVLIQAALRADLVVLPCKVHTFDASQVVRTIRNLEKHAGEAKLPISPHRVLFNEYDSLDRNTRPLREVLAYLADEQVPVCINALYRRVTYRTMTSGHGTLYQMNDKDESIRKARYNADQVVRELLTASQGAELGSPPHK